MDQERLRALVAGAVGCEIDNVVSVRVRPVQPPFRREAEVVAIVRDAPTTEVGPKYVWRMSELVERGEDTGGDDEEIEATERARELAEELGVDLHNVGGSGVGGTVLVRDVRRAGEHE